MRVAVISDTHMPKGNRVLPPSCVARLRRADLVLHGGDVVTFAFLEELGQIGPPVVAVYGNVDEPALRSMLPEQRIVEVEDARIGLVHIAGARAGREARLGARFPGCDAIVYGHSHQPQVERVNGVWILNPGSPTERRRAPARTMLELVVTGRRIAPRLVDLGT